VDACQKGDFRTVYSILQNIKDFNIDITDNLGRSALRLAVSNEQFDVVNLLIERSDSDRIKEALLLAIYEGDNLIAKMILNHPRYKVLNEKKFMNATTDSFWQTQSENSQFSPDITPIMLAAQYNRTEIVQTLLLNGDYIEKPHDYYCKCNECKNRFEFDSLRHAQSRLNAFRAISSESYISLVSVDPFLTAFEINNELKLLADKEKHFKVFIIVLIYFYCKNFVNIYKLFFFLIFIYE
jgi:ankyrin repeat protein